MLDEDFELKFREEKRSLEEMARAARSTVTFRKSLVEKCLECIFKNATLLHDSIAARAQFTRLTPVMRREFLKKLESWFDARRIFYQAWTVDEYTHVFSLVQLLLNEFITEFNFEIFGRRFGMDQQTWKLLSERCPNLTRVEDSRFRSEADNAWLGHTLPLLLRLGTLEHIKLKHYRFPGRVLQLLKAFPNLRSLGVSLDRLDMNQELLDELCKLHNLEFLWIGPLQDDAPEVDLLLAANFKTEMMAQCLRRLPLLQEVDIFVWSLEQRREFPMPHNNWSALERPLALRTLRLKEGLKGWSCEQLPHVTKLVLRGPLWDADQYLGFPNLTCLHLSHVGVEEQEMLATILGHYAGRLRELKIHTCEDLSINLCVLFDLCPNLEVLELDDEVACFGDDSEPNVRNLKSVRVWLRGGPSSVLMDILKAPHLEELTLNDIEFSEAQIKHLMVRLQDGDVLQRLRRVTVTFFDVNHDGRPNFASFLQLLVVYAPRLSDIVFRDNTTISHFQSSRYFEWFQLSGVRISTGSEVWSPRYC